LLFGEPGTTTLKRLAPGLLLKAEPGLLTHDATTLGGSSGSPVIAWSGRQRVIGLHFKGHYGVANYCIPLWQLANGPFFATAGISIG
jgi:V8-like Glu-specific endopeptidase